MPGLLSEIEQWKSKYSRLEGQLKDTSLSDEENRRLKEQLAEAKRELEKLRGSINTEEINQLHMQIEELQRQLQEQEGEMEQTYEQRMTVIQSEVDTWKKRFVELNRNYNQLQEEHMMLNAE
jgi:chromosome segregation ATPase